MNYLLNSSRAFFTLPFREGPPRPRSQKSLFSTCLEMRFFNFPRQLWPSFHTLEGGTRCQTPVKSRWENSMAIFEKKFLTALKKLCFIVIFAWIFLETSRKEPNSIRVHLLYPYCVEKDKPMLTRVVRAVDFPPC